MANVPETNQVTTAYCTHNLPVNPHDLNQKRDRVFLSVPNRSIDRLIDWLIDWLANLLANLLAYFCIYVLECVSLDKSNLGFLNPKQVKFVFGF